VQIGSTIELSNGVRLPVLGLGVFRARPGAATQDAVRWALELGYRHIDTAHIYGNERDVGAALRAAGVPRGEVFVTTKLGNRDHGYDAARRAFERSLAALGLDHVDLYLIHWPVPEGRAQSWRALEAIYAEGGARAVGVSNYMEPHLRELLAEADVPPMVDQFELHPFLAQTALVDLCRRQSIAIEAYSPLTRGRRLHDPVVQAVAAAHARTAAQVVLRWSLQKGFVPLPKSVHRARIAENAALFDFELSASEMARLDALDEGLHVAWDPTGVD
jgi:diketogulonate reductase-like aldo/keto reductase